MGPLPGSNFLPLIAEASSIRPTWGPITFLHKTSYFRARNVKVTSSLTRACERNSTLIRKMLFIRQNVIVIVESRHVNRCLYFGCHFL